MLISMATDSKPEAASGVSIARRKRRLAPVGRPFHARTIWRR